jgi:chromosomal replication initiation ATPase DnaA
MAAWLCRRWTGATLRELGSAFGLTGTDSVSNLVRRAQQQFKESASWRKRASKIEASLNLNTEHKA